MKAILGVDIGGTNIKLGMVAESGDILESGSIPTLGEKGPYDAARRIAEWLEERGGDDVTAAGIACAGLIDGGRGLLYSSPNLPGWKNAPISEIFGSLLKMPVVVDNDANCAAWGEYCAGSGKGSGIFVCLTLGTGVGGGIVLDGKLYRGSQGLAGEIGHHIVLEGGPICGCGNRGCLEAMIKAGAIVARAAGRIEASGESVLGSNRRFTAKDVYVAARGGDRIAIETLAETGLYLGVGLINIVHIFNPEIIAVGGGVAGAGDLLLEPARAAMRERMMDEIFSPVRVVSALLGNKASFIGASLLAKELAGD